MSGNRWATSKPTRADKHAEMVTFLYSSHPEKLDSITPEILAHRYGQDAKVAEYHLLIARQRRSVPVKAR